MFSLIQLPYADNALEPIISARTISFHHGKHWKFRCKVTPCVPSQTDPLVRLKMTPWS